MSSRRPRASWYGSGLLLAALVVALLPGALAAPPSLDDDQLHHRPASRGVAPTILVTGLHDARQLVAYEGSAWALTTSGDLLRVPLGAEGGAEATLVATGLSTDARLVTDGQHLLLETSSSLSWWVASESPEDAPGAFAPILSGRAGLHATHARDGWVYWVDSQGNGALFEAEIGPSLNPKNRATQLGVVSGLMRRDGDILIAPTGPEPRGFKRLADGAIFPEWYAQSRLTVVDMAREGDDVWAILMNSRGFIERLSAAGVLTRVCYAQAGSSQLQLYEGDVYWYGPAGIWRLEAGQTRPEALVTNTEPRGLVVHGGALWWLEGPRGQLLSLPLSDAPTSAL
jgi:hypothetical protein